MQQVILDTNVVIDIALKRKLFNNDALKVLLWLNNNQVQAFVTASSVTDIFYILRK
jgi:predicted nucleic acid-binding protein